jgi:hypothetical protein
MARLVAGGALAGLLLIAVVSPLASAGIGTAPTHWSFKFDDRGVWHADGAHVSFSWTLKPLEVYDLSVDGVMLIEELSFPVDATGFTTNGATFKVMMGSMELFSLQDNPAANMGADCGLPPIDPDVPPGACDVEFPQGSEIMVMAAGKNSKMSLFHVEYPDAPGAIVPCANLGFHGMVAVEGGMAMFMGQMHLLYPPGQSMVG